VTAGSEDAAARLIARHTVALLCGLAALALLLLGVLYAAMLLPALTRMATGSRYMGLLPLALLWLGGVGFFTTAWAWLRRVR
jgi:hypothetical protein